MMNKVLLTIVYMVLLPLGLGKFSRSIIGNRKLLTKIGDGAILLDEYVSGILAEFFLFEICGKYVLSVTQSYTDCVEKIRTYSSKLLAFSILMLIFFCGFDALKRAKHKEFKVSIDWIALFLGSTYVAISVLFVTPNANDETIISIIAMIKNNMVAVFDPYTGAFLEDMSRHTKLVEVYYAVVSDLLGVGLTQFIEYIASGALLVFFFGVYKRIECLLIYRNSIMALKRKQMEAAFFSICMALLFVKGDICISIPNNIWNGDTLLFSCVLPLCFVYGYMAVVEDERGNRIDSVYWLLQMVILLPVAAFLHDYGIQLGLVLIIVAVIVIIIKGITSCLVVEKKVK